MPNQGDFLDSFLTYSHQEKATDLHLCPSSKPLVRVNGVLKEIPDTSVMNPDFINDILDSLLNETHKNKLAQSKVLDFSFSKRGLGRFRANVYSQRGTYAAAIRMLPFEIPEFAELGLPKAVEGFTSKSKGLFLVTGATGSGKSTTLASLLNMINENHSYHILTIEDPIEYLHSHKKSLVSQREIGEDAESFASALRAALREDPDVIMVGEMRDSETISIALTAAETGHLVFSTLHTIGAAKSIDRIIDAFPPAQHDQVKSQLATVLEGIVSQQLIPTADKNGLVIASEIMFVNPAIRNLIREGKHYQINSIIQTGQAQGMQLMDMDLAKLYTMNVISEEELLLRLNDHQLMRQFTDRR